MSIYIDMYIAIYIDTYISISIRVDILGSPNRWKLIVTVTYAFTSSCVPYTYSSYNFFAFCLTLFIMLHHITLYLSPLTESFSPSIFLIISSFHPLDHFICSIIHLFHHFNHLIFLSIHHFRQL